MKALALITALTLSSGCAYNSKGQLDVWTTMENVLITATMCIAIGGTVSLL